jgi:hypothetical protein
LSWTGQRNSTTNNGTAFQREPSFCWYFKVSLRLFPSVDYLSIPPCAAVSTVCNRGRGAYDAIGMSNPPALTLTLIAEPPAAQPSSRLRPPRPRTPRRRDQTTPQRQTSLLRNPPTSSWHTKRSPRRRTARCTSGSSANRRPETSPVASRFSRPARKTRPTVSTGSFSPDRVDFARPMRVIDTQFITTRLTRRIATPSIH